MTVYILSSYTCMCESICNTRERKEFRVKSWVSVPSALVRAAYKTVKRILSSSKFLCKLKKMCKIRLL